MRIWWCSMLALFVINSSLLQAEELEQDPRADEEIADEELIIERKKSLVLDSINKAPKKDEEDTANEDDSNAFAEADKDDANETEEDTAQEEETVVDKTEEIEKEDKDKNPDDVVIVNEDAEDMEKTEEEEDITPIPPPLTEETSPVVEETPETIDKTAEVTAGEVGVGIKKDNVEENTETEVVENNETTEVEKVEENAEENADPVPVPVPVEENLTPAVNEDMPAENPEPVTVTEENTDTVTSEEDEEETPVIPVPVVEEGTTPTIVEEAAPAENPKLTTEATPTETPITETDTPVTEATTPENPSTETVSPEKNPADITTENPEAVIVEEEEETPPPVVTPENPTPSDPGVKAEATTGEIGKTPGEESSTVTNTNPPSDGEEIEDDNEESEDDWENAFTTDDQPGNERAKDHESKDKLEDLEREFAKDNDEAEYESEDLELVWLENDSDFFITGILGMQNDSFEFSTSQGSVDESSSWDVQGIIIGVKAESILRDNMHAHIDYVMTFSHDGNADNDLSSPSTDLSGKSDGGSYERYSLGIDYRFNPIDNVQVAPRVGFFESRQEYEFVNRNIRGASATNPNDFMNSKFDTIWNGGYIGGSVHWKASEQLIWYAILDLSLLDYETKASLNLRPTLDPGTSMKQTGDGLGIDLRLGVNWRFQERLYLDAYLHMADWNVDGDLDVNLATGSSIDGSLDDASFNSLFFGAGVSYAF